MCGISGFCTMDKTIDKRTRRKIITTLLSLSESRGKDATGVSLLNNNSIVTAKAALKASTFINCDLYKSRMNDIIDPQDNRTTMCIGHDRLATNGIVNNIHNCHPICKNNLAIVHNGIIVNEQAIKLRHPEWKFQSEVDTEIIANYFIQENLDIKSALDSLFCDIYGMTSICVIDSTNRRMIAATNNGSLYYLEDEQHRYIIFASEKYVLETLQKKIKALNLGIISQIKPYEYISVSADDALKITYGVIKKRVGIPDRNKKVHLVRDTSLFKEFDADIDKISKLKRCTKCLLPETMPFIEFDADGVCNYCRNWVKPVCIGEDKLRSWAEDYKKNGNKKILASFSGGRDSSYSLHFLKRELGLNVVAYGYDWGMNTDIGRRNQARMSDKLGIEFIVVSADIKKKRDNIRKNIVAWLKRPSLGMVPLFMAGDKQYFYYANEVARQNEIPVICLATNRYEVTNFKYGFCNIEPSVFKKGWNKGTEQLPVFDVIRMAGYYGKEFILNPSYLNSSVFDTAKAAISNYGIKHDYLRLFDYIDWDEKVVDDVLQKEYDWEISENAASTWRIGDGTAPFYNYIYYTLCGFTEADCLRSNQIRAGKMTRTEGLALVNKENQFNYQDLQWYFEAIGLDMKEVLLKMKTFKKRY